MFLVTKQFTVISLLLLLHTPLQADELQLPAHLLKTANFTKTKQTLLGAVETLTLSEGGLLMDARIDTGAELSSLDAREIREFKKDGEKWVNFQIIDRQSGVKKKLSLPIKNHVKIKRHAQKSQCRPVVCMGISLGEDTNKTLFTLTDRRNFEHPILLGRSYLHGKAIVDVSHNYLLKSSSPFN
ncbi:RimK/LysX family protein [Parendozoicomonas sp. Alg238-R29]|uniref:ATP-dependent zinc protease family protein n=1 Tax=Parendozoicomonas sp. Alg238-R29 TaxID=2993446 RepID=UPI00248E1D7C|nr:RimK/LysX family protein [Parendozoicomonas sp. Alg238-R29]